MYFEDPALDTCILLSRSPLQEASQPPTQLDELSRRIDLDEECQLVLNLNVSEPDEALAGIPVFHFRVDYKDGRMCR
ncbi:MAG: hypothetical protein M1816_005930 [Peltula sp. TS41687]|nr:MAG: hypothetical protein M1816_005930 [Peltula sp. TS41687]